MADTAPFSIAVVGLGMIGAAACRHLSLMAPDPGSIIGIGAPEPAESGSVFASHHDQGRLTRIVDPDPVWSQLAARSISRYADIEQDSGISFHGKVGSIRVSPFYNAAGDSLARSLEVGRSNGANVKLVGNLCSEFPYFGFKDGEVAVMEYGGAGYINPREMVKAQIAIAKSNGMVIVHDTVLKIERLPDGVLKIFTEAGRIFFARRVLICAGAYTNFILPGCRKLAVKIKAVSILLAEVDSEELKKAMPSFIWRLKSHPLLHSVYGCPPIKYPDGKTYIKIGGTMWDPKCISTEEEFLEWFHGQGCKAETDALLPVLLELLPGLRIQSLQTKPCVVSYSVHNRPYVDAVEDDDGSNRVFVATYGCGASAKSSDEIGRMAALLVLNGKWAYPEMNSSLFRAVFVDESGENQACKL